MRSGASMALGALLLACLGGCSLQTSEAADLGPEREACAPLGSCRLCPCPGTTDLGYQICDNRGYYVKHGTPTPGCTCPPFSLEKPAECDEGAAGSGGQ